MSYSPFIRKEDPRIRPATFGGMSLGWLAIVTLGAALVAIYTESVAIGITLGVGAWMVREAAEWITSHIKN